MGVKITDTVLRDAHQCLLATRLRTEDMLPIAEKLDQVGYYSLEVWGGATFDTPLRFLKEDPWERLRLLKRHIRRTPLQMLLRGQNVVGYRHYADDVVERFVYRAREDGIEIFRVFDALNDIRNLVTAMRATKACGGHAQGCISYTISPVHTLEAYVSFARQLVDLGADSICIKDMAGLLHPYDAYALVKALKEEVSVPIQLHTHCTSGMAETACLKAVEAGVDIIDSAISAMAGANSQPPTESLVAALQGSPYDAGLDLELLAEIARYFAEVRRRYAVFETGMVGVDASVLIHQIPGGMTSNLMSQLKEQNALDRLEEVLAEIPRVRRDMGYPPLVTPTSQLVGTQAVLNVLYSERYKVIPKEVRLYLQGYYGTPPGPVDPDLLRKALGEGVEIITGRPADYLEPEVEKAQAEAGDMAQTEEDLLSWALFPQVARDFFQWRREGALPEKELVAAITAALGRRLQAAQPPKAASRTLRSDGPSPWLIAGRHRAMRKVP